MPRKWRHDQRLSGIAGPNDDQQRMVADQVLRRRIERREAESGKQEQPQGVAEMDPHACGFAAALPPEGA